MYTEAGKGLFFYYGLARKIWVPVILISLYTTLIVYFHRVDHIDWFIIPVGIR